MTPPHLAKTKLFFHAMTYVMCAFMLICTPLKALSNTQSRIKDIVQVEGVRSNQLIGYGIVVGLNGSGDSVRNSPMLKQSLQSMMERLGVNVRNADLNTKNAAAVMVTADLPPFAAPGAQLDITVSAMGDAKSLLGGTLLVTPLLGADGEVYAVGQGNIQTGAIAANGGSGSTITKGVPTAGRIPSGGIVEKETGFSFNSLPSLRLTLRNPDIATASAIASTINSKAPGSAIADNPSIVRIRPPQGQTMMEFLQSIEPLMVMTDDVAKIVIDEVGGVIVMGDQVRLSKVAIAQGNLTIRVDEMPAVSQPNPLSGGETAVVPQTQISIEEEKGKKLVTLGGGASLSDLVQGLNALGVTPRDMISILQAVKAAGALQAEIEVM
jgi:flagellar P-ring protein precursor FlgI